MKISHYMLENIDGWTLIAMTGFKFKHLFYGIHSHLKKTKKTNIFPATLIPKISKNNLKLHCIAHEVVCHFVQCGLYLEHFQT